jgi:hypothetical protein
MQLHTDPRAYTGVALFCADHHASYHVDVSSGSRWGASEGPSFVSSKRRRAQLVRRIYALAADNLSGREVGGGGGNKADGVGGGGQVWLWAQGNEALAREREMEREVEGALQRALGNIEGSKSGELAG